LIKVLKKYDADSVYTHLEDLPSGSIFRIKNGRSFVKGERIRTRYKCVDTISGKYFLVSPVAEVIQETLF